MWVFVPFFTLVFDLCDHALLVCFIVYIWVVLLRFGFGQ